MKMKKNSLGVILTLALVTGIPTLLAATDNTEKAAPSKYSIASVKGKVPNYPVNEQRQTYGYGPYPYGPTQEPELIKAERRKWGCWICKSIRSGFICFFTRRGYHLPGIYGI